MIPSKNDPFWIKNGTQPVEFEKMPLQIYAVHQGEVTVYLSMEEVDRLIRLVYGDEANLPTPPIKGEISGRKGWFILDDEEIDD
ncbi:MAG: hypothetical protein QNJ45_00185 [Ardenticatenaceae bacterium]|nr:hypothetical protein [Ardenticatenaceae bacterium]